MNSLILAFVRHKPIIIQVGRKMGVKNSDEHVDFDYKNFQVTSKL